MESHGARAGVSAAGDIDRMAACEDGKAPADPSRLIGGCDPSVEDAANTVEDAESPSCESVDVMDVQVGVGEGSMYR